VTTTVLDRAIYTEPEAARLLKMHPSTLHYWLHGGERGGRFYPPVIRPEPTDNRTVTWAEFVESGWLRTYRRQRGIPMYELRRFIELLRDQLDVPYPLAHKRPFVSGKRLVFKLQEESQLEPEFRLVDDQLMLTYAASMFFQRVEWTGDVATGWKPDENPKSTVIVKPDIRFGRPAVGGVSTASIYEQSEAGASNGEIAETFGLAEKDVRWALAYENARAAS